MLSAALQKNSVSDGTIGVVSAEMSVGADGEADVPAEAEKPGGRSGDRAGDAGAREHREQRQRAPRPRHQLQQCRDNATTQGPEEVRTSSLSLR